MGYFTVEVKPTITASKQHVGAFAAGDILFNWTAFQIPKGSARLLNTFATARGTDAANQGALDIELFFAKSIGNADPTDLGVINAAVTASGWQNNLIGYQLLDYSANSTGSSDDLVFMTTLQSGSRGGGPDVVLTGEPISGTNVGFDTIYVAGIAQGAYNFSTTVLARGGEESGVTVVKTDKGSDDDPDAELIFVPGDVLHSATDDVLGTVKSIAAFGSSKQDITFEAATPDVIADNEEIYNVHPVVLKFSFEQ